MEGGRDPGEDEMRKVNIDGNSIKPERSELSIPQAAVFVHPRLETDHTNRSPREQ